MCNLPEQPKESTKCTCRLSLRRNTNIHIWTRFIIRIKYAKWLEAFFNIVTRKKCLCCVICTTLQEERAKYRPNQINPNMTNSVSVISPTWFRSGSYCSIDISMQVSVWVTTISTGIFALGNEAANMTNYSIAKSFWCTWLRCDSLKFYTEILS